jgi:hypothetical protein
MTYKGKLNKDNIPENGIFVFGSNPLGINGNPKNGKGGAALVAHLEFGVEQGELMNNCLSKSGKAYGLVTVNAPKKYISNEEIKNNIEKLYTFAKENVDKLFYVAYSGENPNYVSLNGKSIRTLANLFYQAGMSGGVILKIPENIVFEENFYKLVIPCDLEKGFDF